MNGIRPPPESEREDSFMIFVIDKIDTSHITKPRYQELLRKCTSGSWGQKDPERLITVCRPDQECAGRTAGPAAT